MLFYLQKMKNWFHLEREPSCPGKQHEAYSHSEQDFISISICSQNYSALLNVQAEHKLHLFSIETTRI